MVTNKYQSLCSFVTLSLDAFHIQLTAENLSSISSAV